MTGIRPNKPEILSDIPSERYSKMATACSNKYKIIQVGLCLFIRKEWGLVARPYNIYVFPRESNGYSPQIVIDSSAADFNTRHGMNWNKWFSEGVTYMSMREANKKQEEGEKAENSFNLDNPEIKLTKEEDIKKMDILKKDISEWLARGDKMPFKIDNQNRFLRKYIYDFLNRDFPHIMTETLVKKINQWKKKSTSTI